MISEGELPGAPDHGSEAPGHLTASDPFGRALEYCATLLAIVGGIVLTALSAFTVVSVIGRATFDSPILGDSEVTEMACGLAVFMFLPYCQIKGGNIVVDFFTVRISNRRRAAMDALHNFVFLVVVVIITWRMIVGGLDAWHHGEISMMLRLPIWIGYSGGILALILLALVCLYTVYLKFTESRS